MFSVDDTDGTGDHENYLVETKTVFALDGIEYGDCKKIAVHIRSRSRHEPWYGLSGKYSDIIFLFSKRKKFYISEPLKPDPVQYRRALRADYG